MPYKEEPNNQSVVGCMLLVFFVLVSLGALLGAIACGMWFGATFGFAVYGVYLCLLALLFLAGVRKSKGGE